MILTKLFHNQKYFQVSRTIQYLSFCNLLVSLSIMSFMIIHVEGNVSEFPSFLRLNNIPSMDTWVTSMFQFL